MTAQELLSIKEAASYLSVSTKSLRRWEKKGLISVVRTSGGHRRYSLQSLKDFRRKKNTKPDTSQSSFFEAPTGATSVPATSKKLVGLKALPIIKAGEHNLKQDLPSIYHVLPKTSKRIFQFSLAIFTLLGLIFFLAKANLNLEKILGSQISSQIEAAKQNVLAFLPFKSRESAIDKLRSEIVKGEIEPEVLAASSFQNVVFNVYTESIFHEDASFLQKRTYRKH